MKPHIAVDMSAKAFRRYVAPLAPFVVGLALTALAFAFVRHHAVDWFYNDDLATLRWFGQADAGRLPAGDLVDLWNNEHPVGTQFALFWLARLALGLHMGSFVMLSIGVVVVTACMAARLAVDGGDPVAARCTAIAACFALAFQPTQMEHLLWAFELGWFVVNAVVVVDAALTERFGPRAALPVVALCAVASLASAQGAFTFFAAALHQALMPGRPGRRGAVAVLAFGGILAVAHLLWHPHASVSGPTPTDHAFLATAVFAVEVLGGLFGLRGHPSLLAGGLALLAATALLLWRRRRTARPDRQRCALVLIGFSALCLGAFAQARHRFGIDWATASFHAAPLLVPFALGLVVLLGAPPARRTSMSRIVDRATAIVVVLLLAGATASAVPYGITYARLWAMDRGYARWATCTGEGPDIVAARGSGVGYDLAGFMAVRPLVSAMCATPAGPLEATLVRRPPLFDALAAGRPEVDRALAALWQDYATSLALQRAFKPWRPDTPTRLLAFAKADAAKGSEIDPERLAAYADVFRRLSP